MQKSPKQLVLAIAGSILIPAAASAQFATSVVNYSAGTGAADGYDDPTVALGAPSTITPGEFGGPVTPFAAPYLATQNVSLGEGGSLTVQFANPIQNDASNPFGIDFLIFGGTSFIDADWPNGITDGTGSTFGQNTGTTQVYVGNDVNNMYLLNPSLAPAVDGLFPTDGSGNFQVPVNPALANGDFADKTLDEIRALYGGSGGGTGFDLAWAVDGQNNPVALDSIQFVRVEVLSGRSEIDGFAATTVPEPSTFLLALAGGSLMFWPRLKKRG